MTFQKFATLLLFILFTFLAACTEKSVTPPPDPESSANIIKAGNEEPVSPDLKGPSIYLMGKDMSALSSYDYFLDTTANSLLDIVVLAGSSASGRAVISGKIISINEFNFESRVIIDVEKGEVIFRNEG